MSLNKFIVYTLGLTKLPPHLPTLAAAALGFLVVHQILAPWGSKRWFPEAYSTKSRRARNNWSIHVVSQVHAVIIVPLALYILANETKERGLDRAFGWADEVGFVHGIAAGYFLWDSLDAIINFTDLGFVIHGVACFMIYTMSFKPFVAYYGTRCLLWETSTFFLNIHWFMDKTGRTGSRVQLINGFLLLSAFFGVRIVYGGKVSYDFVHTLVQVRHDIPAVYFWVYGLGNLMLQGLNWFWFYKMISALKKRFEPQEGQVKLLPTPEENGYNSLEDGEQGHEGRHDENGAAVTNGYGTN